jgi:hypothetical protein
MFTRPLIRGLDKIDQASGCFIEEFGTLELNCAYARCLHFVKVTLYESEYSPHYSVVAAGML